jgi:hypothetical protein
MNLIIYTSYNVFEFECVMLVRGSGSGLSPSPWFRRYIYVTVGLTNAWICVQNRAQAPVVCAIAHNLWLCCGCACTVVYMVQMVV